MAELRLSYEEALWMHFSTFPGGLALFSDDHTRTCVLPLLCVYLAHSFIHSGGWGAAPSEAPCSPAFGPILWACFLLFPQQQGLRHHHHSVVGCPNRVLLCLLFTFYYDPWCLTFLCFTIIAVIVFVTLLRFFLLTLLLYLKIKHFSLTSGYLKVSMHIVMKISQLALMLHQ